MVFHLLAKSKQTRLVPIANYFSNMIPGLQDNTVSIGFIRVIRVYPWLIFLVY